MNEGESLGLEGFFYCMKGMCVKNRTLFSCRILFFVNMNMCNTSDYFRMESTSFRASAVSSLILSNSPLFTSSPFTIQLPPQHIILSKER